MKAQHLSRHVRVPVALILLAATSVLAGPAPGTDGESAAPAPAVAPAEAAAAHAAFQADLEGIFAREAERVTALQADFAAATDEETALAAQRGIAEVRAKTELAMLGAQVRYARRLGRVDLAARIETAIAELRDPNRALKKARPDDTRR